MSSEKGRLSFESGEKKVVFLLAWTLLPAILLFLLDPLGYYEFIVYQDWALYPLLLAIMALTFLYQWHALKLGIIPKRFGRVVALSQWIVGLWPLGFLFAFWNRQLHDEPNYLLIAGLIYLALVAPGVLWSTATAVFLAPPKSRSPQETDILDLD